MIVYGKDDRVGLWLLERLEDVTNLPGGFAAIGVARGDELIGGCLYTTYRPSVGGGDIQMWAAGERGWLTRGTVIALLGYPFEFLRCHRVTCAVAKRNKRSRRLLAHLGFRVEGNIRQGFNRKNDAILYGMLDGEYATLKERLVRHGQRYSKAA